MKQEMIIITGAASGIGRATAIAFAKQAKSLALIDQNKEDLKQIQAEFGERLISIYEGDVSNPKQMKEIFTNIAVSTKTVTTLFANAGINGIFTSIEAFDPEDWDKTISINLKGTFLSVKYAIPLMKENGGSIVITSSVNGTRVFSNVGMSAYSSSKAAVAAFGKMAALELSNYGIRVNVICPGAIQTNIGERTHKHETELKSLEFKKETDRSPTPPGTPEQVADMVTFLTSDKAKHISGTEIVIDGAQTLL